MATKVREIERVGGELKLPTAKVFVPLLKPSRYKGAHGGRASGKSHFFAERMIERCAAEPGLRCCCVREVQKDLKESAKLLLNDKITAMRAGGFKDLTDRVITPKDGLIIFRGMQEYTAESIKSLEGFDILWAEEAQTISERSLELIRPTIRKPGSEIWASWNPRSASDPIDKLLRGPRPPEDAIVVQSNWRDNPWFSQVMEDERQHDLLNNPLRYGHIWEGDYEPQAVGAIWERGTFHQWRTEMDKVPAQERIVVGTDPATSSDREKSDEYGIVVCGRGRDKRGYIFEDASDVYTPHQWATQCIALYDFYEADAIVVERNQGGDHVVNTIRAVRPDAKIIDVHVTRRKPDRAKPISALYKQGKVSHVGTLEKLEDQMCLMTSVDYEGEGSPDRVDALVLGMTDLFPTITRSSRKPRENEPKEGGEGGWMR